jgi:GDP-4-dehydro-6-deoxy-D-mannose reductase
MIADNDEPSCVLITGGTGFVGTHLIQFLKPRGSRIVVISSGGGSEKEPDVEYYEADIRREEAVKTIVRQVRPDRIYHLAGVSAVDVSWKDPRLTYEVNVLGARNVFEAAMKLPKPPKILNVSTSQVYAASNQPLDEDSPIRPDNPYAASKAMAELLVAEYRREAAGGIITARPFNHTGPGQTPNFVLPSLAKQFAEMELGLRPAKLTLGNIAVKRDFTDVRDVVAAYCMLLERGRISDVYNVCSGTAVWLADIVALFQAVSGVQADVVSDLARMRPAEASETTGDAGKIRNETGWTPKIDLKKTIADLLDYWRDRTRATKSTSTGVC